MHPRPVGRNLHPPPGLCQRSLAANRLWRRDHGVGVDSGVTGAGRVRIGIDIGGPFTDLQILDERSGALHSLTTATTPHEGGERTVLVEIEAGGAGGGYVAA